LLATENNYENKIKILEEEILKNKDNIKD